MANYIGWILTNKGRGLVARAIGHEIKINITKFKIGAGYNNGNDRELTALIDKRNEFPISSYVEKGDGIVEFTFIISNKNEQGESTISNSYKISEMGIFAEDDAGNEILYAYNKGTDGDYIPVYNGKNAIDIIEKCIIVVDQSATLNVVIDNSMTYLTREAGNIMLEKFETKFGAKIKPATDTVAGVVTLNKIREVAPTPPRAGVDTFGVISKNEIRELTATEELRGTVSLSDIKNLARENRRNIASGGYTVTATPQNINLAEYGFKENSSFTIIPFFKNLPININLKNIRINKIENPTDNRIFSLNVLGQIYSEGSIQSETKTLSNPGAYYGNMGETVFYSTWQGRIKNEITRVYTHTDSIYKNVTTVSSTTYIEIGVGENANDVPTGRIHNWRYDRNGRHSNEYTDYRAAVMARQEFAVAMRWKLVGTEVWNEWEEISVKNFTNSNDRSVKKYDVEVKVFLKKVTYYVDKTRPDGSVTERGVVFLNVTIKKNTTSNVVEEPMLGTELNWIAYEN